MIPAGAGEALDAGTPLEILPAELEVQVGESIRIDNEDDRGHNVGPFFVGANETLTQRFSSPGDFEGACTVHPSGQFALIVTASDMGLRRVRGRAGHRPRDVDRWPRRRSRIRPGPPTTSPRSSRSCPDVDHRLSSIVGGDSFFELRVEPGTEVFVIGYQGEEYLWFRPDGAVWENQNSPSTYLNADRLGGDGIPDTATADAEPDWKRVAGDGHFAWHDHRAHWMQRPALRSRPGRSDPRGGDPARGRWRHVEVTVTSTWQPAPSPLPRSAAP